MAKNKYFRPIRDVINDYRAVLNGYDLEEQLLSPLGAQLDVALALARTSVATKVIHPLFIKEYRRCGMRYRESPIECVGLDIETNPTTGLPMLIGFAYADGGYEYIHKPTIEKFAKACKNLCDNTSRHLAAWGNLDIQAVIRIFSPTEQERALISRGIGANIVDGKFISPPPCLRHCEGYDFFISHYIPGRSLKLGIIKDGFDQTFWVFNIAQFYPQRIAEVAKALSLPWFDYAKNTHVVDWEKFTVSRGYQAGVIASNKQDAITVQKLSETIQQQFYLTFDAYPSLLVSTGSLTDAAVSKMLEKDDYASTSWKWLVDNIYSKQDGEIAEDLGVMASEAYSAGYVDQYALGYFPKVCTADIAGAYPHKIRALPDLRHSYLVKGESIDYLDDMCEKHDVESVFFRGLVEIPSTLKYHPITIKTYGRENYRPQGRFYAAYTLEERNFVIDNGGTFSEEEWIAIVLDERMPSPIAKVSERLGQLRDEQLAQRDAHAKTSPEWAFLDGQQYVTKVIDNSIYGKTVMTTEVVEMREDTPEIIGYIAGDRFNQIYGALITARTRVQIARACVAIEDRGGKPIMTMTDSIYWHGTPDMLPQEYIREQKTSGYFEKPHYVTEFFILKTGQYEYKNTSGKWEYKLRGLPVDWEYIDGADKSFYRRIIKEQTYKKRWMTGDKVAIEINTKRLQSVGQRNLDKIALIEDSSMILKPFELGGKQVEEYIVNWQACLNDHAWLETPQIDELDAMAAKAPLFYLRQEYEKLRAQEIIQAREKGRVRNTKKKQRTADLKTAFVWKASTITHKAPPQGKIRDIPWEVLEGHYGITKEELAL